MPKNRRKEKEKVKKLPKNKKTTKVVN